MKKPKVRGEALVEQVIAALAKKKRIRITVPEPVPKTVLAKLTIGPKAPLSPSMRRWLAFDAGWVARQLGWFEDPTRPVFAPEPIDVIVHRQLSSTFASYYAELPGRLAKARALPLDVGSDSMRLLALVPGADGEYPVLYVDVDDFPVIGVEAPAFDVWLAEKTGLVDGKTEYKAEIALASKSLFGKGTAELSVPSEAAEKRFQQRMKKSAAPEPSKKSAVSKKPSTFEVPKLSETALGEALGEAIGGGRAERIAAFLEAGKTRFPKGKAWRAVALAAAVDADDTPTTKALLGAGADPDTRRKKDPLLVFALGFRSTGVAVALLDAGADLRAKGDEGTTALHAACEAKNVDAVRILLERGADPNAVDAKQLSPLGRAARLFQPKRDEEMPKALAIAKLLLTALADPRKGAKDWRTPLHSAIDDRQIELADLLLDHGADPSVVDWRGENALMSAFRHGALATFDRLLGMGVRRNQKNKDGWCLDDVVEADTHLPASLDVRVRCSETPQRVRVDAVFLTDDGTLPSTLHSHLCALAAMAEGGFLGSNAFSPAIGHGTYIDDEPDPLKRKAVSRPKGTPPFARFGCVFTLAGVSPAGLALWARQIATHYSDHLAELRIKGELLLDGSPLDVDTHRVASWLGDPSVDPIERFEGAKTPIAEASRHGGLCRLTAADGIDRDALRGFSRGLSASIGAIVPMRVSDLRDRIAILRGGRLYCGSPDETDGPTFSYGYNLRMAKSKTTLADPVVARALFENGVERLASEKKILAAEWNYGVVGRAASREGTDEAFANLDAIEIAPSSNAECKTCREEIDEGEYRFAEKTEIGFRYHHVRCAARRLPKRLRAAISRHEIDPQDKKELVALMATADARRASVEATASAIAVTAPPTPSGKPGATTVEAEGFPYVEIAKSSRSLCIGCDKPIEKDTYRIAVARVVETPQNVILRPGYLHPTCAKGWPGVSLAALRKNTADLPAAGWKMVGQAI